MKRTPVATVLVAALTTLAGCAGTSTATGTATVAPQPTVAPTTAPTIRGPAAPTPAAAKVAGIPALSGKPTDAGQPPAPL